MSASSAISLTKYILYDLYEDGNDDPAHSITEKENMHVNISKTITSGNRVNFVQQLAFDNGISNRIHNGKLSIYKTFFKYIK